MPATPPAPPPPLEQQLFVGLDPGCCDSSYGVAIATVLSSSIVRVQYDSFKPRGYTAVNRAMLYRLTIAALIVSASAFAPTDQCKAQCEINLQTSTTDKDSCKRQCQEDYPPTQAEWNAMCEAGNGVVGTMPSVEVCKERGEGEYSCGADGPCTQSPMGNCKGRCEDEVPRCKARCDDPSLRSCKGQCEDTGKYAPRPDGKAPMWEGDAGSCKNQCNRFYK